MKVLEKLSKDYMRRVNMEKKMQQFVDGCGTDRIVSELLVKGRLKWIKSY